MRFQAAALGTALAGGALCAALAFREPERFFPAYLVGFTFWAGLSLGSVGLLLLHALTGGAWGRRLRVPLRAGAATLPVAALLFLPLFAGLRELYPWARPEALAEDVHLRHQSVWLNPALFALRGAFLFGLALLLARRRFPPGPALLAFGVAVTLAAFDWTSSLEPRFISGIAGLLALAGHALGALALAVLAERVRPDPPPPEEGTERDLGNLLLAFVLLWAYLGFSQYLIVWMADRPDEVPWILRRSGPGWGALALVLVVFHFAVPFLLLLSRGTKTEARRLAAVAALLLAMRLADAGWTILPAFGEAPLWLVVPPVVALGGAWLAAFARGLKEEPSRA